ncbi:catalase [Trichonephila inaurata madagascariensis]|uniref:Catalase n=1 Tax=Trichonephila inaurata madagascariensis TaxID=2747483 RepID=A0A8X6WMN3_9ARAC|nr:catalase [Trichonephila inaurata madagascariensis]
MADGRPNNGRDEADEQLNQFRNRQKGRIETLTTAAGIPIADKLNSLTIGPNGPILLQDSVYIEEVAHFDRERVPERVVHAKGAGAFGFFEVTNDISQYTRARVFNEVGKRTPIAVRFSFVSGESGTADSTRDPRGFAIKFYTEEGNWDLVGNNTPIFFIRDPILFPSFIHSQKRNPVTHLKDADMFWDFLSLRPESTHQVSILFSDRGIPYGYRYMNGYGSNTFKLINAENEAVYCKFIYKSDQGIKNLTNEAARELAGTDPDYAIRDLYDAIANGQFPSWTFYIQVMTFEEAANFRFNPFDVTKVWPQKEFPLIEVGKLVLNRNPKNYFAEVEQIAFSVASLVPGIESSPDKMLQGRLFSYSDTQRYRLGTNFLQLPVNCPYRVRPRNYERDGEMTIQSQDGAPNYYPNSFGGPVNDRTVRQPPYYVAGDVDRYNSENEDNFTQAGIFYREVLDDDQRTRLVENIAGNLVEAQDFIQERAVKNFSQADPEYGRRVKEELNKLKAQRVSK